MTELEFFNAKKELESQQLQQMKELQKKCALADNKIKIGMIIRDSDNTTIKVESIAVYISQGGYPTLKFSGKNRKMDGSPMKYPKDDYIFKSSSIKIVDFNPE